MAGPTVKEILLKWGIDNSNWKSAITELAQLLEKSNKESAKAHDQSQKRLEAQKAKLKEIIADQKSETEEIKKQISQLKVKAAASTAAKTAAVAKLATEKASSAEAEKQTALQRTLQSIQKTLQQEVNTKLMNEKLVTAEINKQNAALRLQATQARLSQPVGGFGRRQGAGGGTHGGGAGAGGGGAHGGGGHHGGHGFLGGLLGGFASRLAGTIGFAVLSAEGLGRVLESLYEKTKRFVEESGPLEQVREQFEKLSNIKGISSLKFLEEMRGATHNLVADVELYRTANKFMQSGINISTEDMSRLMQATVGLARSQGRDATQAVNALNMALATGRFQRLAYITGLTREELTVRGLSATMSSHQRIQLQTENALKKTTDRYKAFGEPVLTVTEVLKQLEVVSTRLFEGFARGVVQSRGMATALDFLQEVMAKLASGEDGAEGLGKKFGDFFIVATEVAKAVASITVSIGGLYQKLVEVFAPTSISDEFITRLTTFSGIMKTAAQAAVLIKGAVAEMALRAEYTGKEETKKAEQLGLLVAPPAFNKQSLKERLGAHGVADLHKEFLEKLKAQQDQEMKEIQDLETAFNKPQPTTKLGGTTGTGVAGAEDPNIALQKQLSQLRMKSKELDAQLELSIEKGKLEKIKEANEAAYNLGLEDLDEYIQKKKEYRQRDLVATLKEIDAEEKARLTELNEKRKTEFMDPKSYQLSVGNITKETAKKSSEARNAAQREQDALDLRATSEKIAARRKLTDTIEVLEKAQIERTRQNTEYEFQQGTMGAQEYLDKKVQFIEQDYEATRTAEEKKLSESKNSELAKVEFASKMAKASEEREKALTSLTLSEIDIRTKAVEASYDRAQRLIESQLQYQQSLSKGSYFGGRGEERSLIEAQINLLKSRLEQETKSLSLTEKGSEAWFQQYEKIMSTKDALVHYNEELAKSRDIASGISSSLQVMAGAAARFPKGGGKVSEALGGLAGTLEAQEQIRQRQAQRAAASKARAEGRSVAPVTPEEIFRSLQKVSEQAGQDIGRHLEAASASVEEWRQKLVNSNSELDSSIAKTTKALFDLAAQIVSTTGALGTGKSGGAGSGPSTADSPVGTATASDMEKLQPAWLSSMSSTSKLGGDGASTGLAAVAQSAKSLKDGFKGLIDVSVGNDGLVGYFKNLGKDSQQASDDLSNFADSVSQIAGDIGGLVSAGKGTGGPLQAGLQGMGGGAGLGGKIGSMFGPLGGAIGTGVGAGVGLVMGIFSGKAKKEAEKISKEITAKFNAVLTEVQQGTLGLGSAVTQEINIIQEAVSRLSGKKGGRDELKAILPQMEQQLAQLQAQQQNIIKSFDKQLEVTSAPESQQALVQPIQQIIDTYQQYVLAGGSVTLANKFLQNSFRNLVTQGLDQLNQAQQDAVTNALNYNDLLLQRQQLIQNTNQQIQDIMSRGVAVRQMPEGVTKARELQQVMFNAQNQQAQLDQQIAVSAHKLANEQKIFSLATTRVGLETQLVVLQNAQIDKQDAATASLLQEVAAFSGATPGNLPTALGMLGLGGTYINPSQEPGLMPKAPVKTGIAEVDLQNMLQYQQAMAYYQQQASLSSSLTMPSLPVPGMGVTTSGVGGTLDTLASNISSLVQGLSTVFGITMPISAGGGGTTSSGPKNNLRQVSMDGLHASTNSLITSSSHRQAIEENISQLSSSRVQSETQLVNLKMQEIHADMQRIQAWQTMLDSPAHPGTKSQTLEDLLQNVYQTRARQGYGGFNGETSNPV